MYLNQCPNAPGILIVLVMNGSFNIFFSISHRFIILYIKLILCFLLFLKFPSPDFLYVSQKQKRKLDKIFNKIKIFNYEKHNTNFRNYNSGNAMNSYIR